MLPAARCAVDPRLLLFFVAQLFLFPCADGVLLSECHFGGKLHVNMHGTVRCSGFSGTGFGLSWPWDLCRRVKLNAW